MFPRFRDNTAATAGARVAVEGEPSAEDQIRRMFSIVGSAAFFVLAPGVVAGYVPWWISGWRVHASFRGFIFVRIVGAIFILAGIPVLVECFARFAVEGIGTPAPVFPTEHLVVKGFYRFVRNPMYVSVLALLLGQAMFLGDIDILEYAVCAWLAAHLFVISYEEPTLRRTFRAEYEAYRTNVPRWIPRLSPWDPLKRQVSVKPKATA
jgi:protein-S-isoprenylcysteine O-methyltransferase Ste14